MDIWILLKGQDVCIMTMHMENNRKVESMQCIFYSLDLQYLLKDKGVKCSNTGRRNYVGCQKCKRTSSLRCIIVQFVPCCHCNPLIFRQHCIQGYSSMDNVEVILNPVCMLYIYWMNYCIIRQYPQPWKMTEDMVWLDLEQLGQHNIMPQTLWLQDTY